MTLFFILLFFIPCCNQRGLQRLEIANVRYCSLVQRVLTSITSLFFRHLSSILGNKFDHGAEAIMPTIFNLIPNSAKVMATSGVVAVRLIIRVSIC